MINHPNMLSCFIADNFDLISAAKGEPLTREEIDRARTPKVTVAIQQRHENARYALDLRELYEQAGKDWPEDARIGTQLRGRLPANYTVTGRPPLWSPNFTSSDKVKQKQVFARFMVGK